MGDLGIKATIVVREGRVVSVFADNEIDVQIIDFDDTTFTEKELAEMEKEVQDCYDTMKEVY